MFYPAGARVNLAMRERFLIKQTPSGVKSMAFVAEVLWSMARNNPEELIILLLFQEIQNSS
jgi:hypothetical protein